MNLTIARRRKYAATYRSAARLLAGGSDTHFSCCAIQQILNGCHPRHPLAVGAVEWYSEFFDCQDFPFDYPWRALEGYFPNTTATGAESIRAIRVLALLLAAEAVLTPIP